MLIFERAKEIPLFNFNFVVEKFTAVRYNKYKGSSRKLFGKLEFDGGKEMFEELGISFGTALIVLISLYFVVKWAVKNGIKEAYKDITVKDTAEDIEAEEICNELGLNEEEK